jgi:hypothetical protein
MQIFEWKSFADLLQVRTFAAESWQSGRLRQS